MFSLLGSGQTPVSRALPYATPGTGGQLAPGDIWARFNDSGLPSISRAEAKELTERVALLERNVRAPARDAARARRFGRRPGRALAAFGRRLTPLRFAAAGARA